MANDINYEYDPNDSRLTDIKSEEKTELSNLESTYAKMQGNADKAYEGQIDAVEEYEKKQTDLANQSLNLTIKEIEQNKADTKKDYIKEQSGAYVDWQRQSNEYGANAEQMAASGLQNTGYSESSQVSMYNTYQNRVATARESYDRAIVDYNNQISQARLANDTLLAEIAYNSLKEQTELAIEQAQYNNSLLMDLTEKQTEIKKNYWQRYNDTVTAIQREIAQKEEARVNDAQIAYTQAQTALAEEQMKKVQAEIKREQEETAAATAAAAAAKKAKNTKLVSKRTYNGATGSSKNSRLLGNKQTTEVSQYEKTNKPVNTQLAYNTDDLTKMGLAGKSGATIEQMVADGKIIKYREGNQYRFKWDTTYLKTQNRYWQ